MRPWWLANPPRPRPRQHDVDDIFTRINDLIMQAEDDTVGSKSQRGKIAASVREPPPPRRRTPARSTPPVGAAGMQHREGPQRRGKRPRRAWSPQQSSLHALHMREWASGQTIPRPGGA